MGYFYEINKISSNCIGKIPYVKKEKGEICSPGTEITTANECKDALRYASSLGITLQNRTTLVEGFFSSDSNLGVAYQCSYQADGDQSFHFNWDKTVQNDGGYNMICKKGKSNLLTFQQIQ